MKKLISKKIKDKKYNKVEDDWSLKEYLDMALKCIGHYAKGNYAHQMLNDEDSIHFVAEKLMAATYDYNPNIVGVKSGKTCTLKSYRNHKAKHAVLYWIHHLKANRKNISLSLSSNYYHDNDDASLVNFIKDEKQRTPYQILSTTEYVNYILNNSDLSDREIGMIKMYYLDNMILEDIANEYKVAKQFVQQTVQNGIKRICCFHLDVD